MPPDDNQRETGPVDSNNIPDQQADVTTIDPERVRRLATFQLNQEEIGAQLQVPAELLNPYQKIIAEGKLVGSGMLKIKAHQVAWVEGHPGMMKFLMSNEVGYAEDPALAEQRRINAQVTKLNHKRELLRHQAEDDILEAATFPDPQVTSRPKRRRADINKMIHQAEAFDSAAVAGHDPKRPH